MAGCQVRAVARTLTIKPEESRSCNTKNLRIESFQYPFDLGVCMNQRFNVTVWFLFFISMSIGAAEAAPAVNQLKWLFAHGPSDPIVLDLVKQHSANLNSKSGGQLNVVVEELPEDTFISPKTGWSAGGWTGRWGVALKRLLAGEIDLVQIDTAELVKFDKTLEVFELPFLFNNEEHAEKVLAGEVGEGLLERVKLASKGKIRAFAFTYSGGFNVLASSKELKTSEDIKNFRMLRDAPAGGSANHAMRADVFSSFGASLISFPRLENYLYSAPSHFNKGRLDGVLYSYKDVMAFLENSSGTFNPKFISENRWGLFTTIILMNESSYQKLSDKNKKIIKQEAIDLAVKERKLFVDAAQASRGRLERMGIKISKLSAGEEKKLLVRAKPVFDEFKKLPGGEALLKSISSAK